MQSIVNGAHIEAGQHILERLTGEDGVGLDSWLVDREDGDQDHQQEDQHLEEADAQHGGQVVGGGGEQLVNGCVDRIRDAATKLKWRGCKLRERK